MQRWAEKICPLYLGALARGHPDGDLFLIVLRDVQVDCRRAHPYLRDDKLALHRLVQPVGMQKINPSPLPPLYRVYRALPSFTWRANM